MKGFPSPLVLGAFALLTDLTCAAALGRRAGLSPGESGYLTLLTLRLLLWALGRRQRKG